MTPAANRLKAEVPGRFGVVRPTVHEGVARPVATFVPGGLTR